jgi:hypothetical protein
LRIEPPAGISGIVYGAEWSPDLQPGSWQDIPDTGSYGEHRFVLPTSPADRGFMRLKVTAD